MQNNLLLRMQSWLDAQPPREGRTFDSMHPEVLISSAFEALVAQEKALRRIGELLSHETYYEPCLERFCGELARAALKGEEE